MSIDPNMLQQILAMVEGGGGMPGGAGMPPGMGGPAPMGAGPELPQEMPVGPEEGLEEAESEDLELNVVMALLNGGQFDLGGSTLDFSFLPDGFRQKIAEAVASLTDEVGEEEEEGEELPVEEDEAPAPKKTGKAPRSPEEEAPKEDLKKNNNY